MKSADAGPISGAVVSIFKLTAINCRSGVRKNNSLVPAPHRGASPPAVETCHFDDGSGKVVTQISFRPEASDSYATQRPSRENRASAS